MEKLQRLKRYMRRVLDERTPSYLLKEELQRDKLRVRAGKQAWRFEKKLDDKKESKLVRKHWGEMVIQERKVISCWIREGREFFGQRDKDRDKGKACGETESKNKEKQKRKDRRK